MKKIYMIDGASFRDKSGFFEEVAKKIITQGQEWWGRNFDAFNDVLRGGFGTPNEGFILIWKDSKISKKNLKKDFDVLIEIIKDHKDIELRLE